MSKIYSVWQRAAFFIIITALIAFAVIIFIPKQGDRSPTTLSLVRAKALCEACRHYALDHGNAFPPSLDALVPIYVDDRAKLVSPLSPNEPIGYLYTTGLKAPVAITTVVIEDKFAPQTGHRIVSYADGSARILNAPH